MSANEDKHAPSSTLFYEFGAMVSKQIPQGLFTKNTMNFCKQNPWLFEKMFEVLHVEQTVQLNTLRVSLAESFQYVSNLVTNVSQPFDEVHKNYIDVEIGMKYQDYSGICYPAYKENMKNWELYVSIFAFLGYSLQANRQWIINVDEDSKARAAHLSESTSPRCIYSRTDAVTQVLTITDQLTVIKTAFHGLGAMIEIARIVSSNHIKAQLEKGRQFQFHIKGLSAINISSSVTSDLVVTFYKDTWFVYKA